MRVYKRMHHLTEEGLKGTIRVCECFYRAHIEIFKEHAR